MSKSMLLENYARMITDIASENLGEEIVLLDTGEISLFSEFSIIITGQTDSCLLYTSPSPRDGLLSRMPSSA